MIKQGELFSKPEYSITKKIRLIELFGGIGATSMGLKQLGVDLEERRALVYKGTILEAK